MKKLILSLTMLLLSFNSYATEIEREESRIIGFLNNTAIYSGCLEGQVIYFSDHNNKMNYMYKLSRVGKPLPCKSPTP